LDILGTWVGYLLEPTIPEYIPELAKVLEVKGRITILLFGAEVLPIGGMFGSLLMENKARLHE